MLGVALLVVALMILVNALYVSAEFATISSRRTRLAELAADGNAAARALLPIAEDRRRLDDYIAACQVGITLSSLLVGYYGQAQLSPYVTPLLERLGLSGAAAASIAAVGLLVLLTFVQVVLGEILPKSIALRMPERMALLALPPMRVSLVLLRPLVALLNGSAHLVLRRIGRAGLEESHVHHPDELEMIFRESAEGGLIDAGEREMLTKVFHLDERLVRQIMVPRNRVVAVPADAKAGELVRELVPSTHTRFPAYQDSIDQIKGIVHLRELYTLAREDPEATVAGIVHPVPILPEFLSVAEVWSRLRRDRATLAAIFDEYGGVVGIVTIEDVLEEIFGEMQDEFDRERELFRQDPSGQIVVRGDMLVNDANERFLMALPEEPADTVGGLVMDLLERVAREGDEVRVAGMRLEVLATAGQAVDQVRITPLAEVDGVPAETEEEPS